MRCCSTLNAVAKTTVLLFTVLLFHGAILHGMGTQSFAPSQDAAIVLSSGVHVFYRCQRGNSTDENDFPGVTVVLHGNPDQGMGDFMGLSDMLIDEGTAVCVWDRPGIGFSGYALAENIRYTLLKLDYTHLKHGASYVLRSTFVFVYTISRPRLSPDTRKTIWSAF